MAKVIVIVKPTGKGNLEGEPSPAEMFRLTVGKLPAARELSDTVWLVDAHSVDFTKLTAAAWHSKVMWPYSVWPVDADAEIAIDPNA
jgi:hypothetical protein